MNVLMVFAHPNAASFTAALQHVGEDALRAAGHTVTVSNLYSSNFNPVADKIDFDTLSGAKFNYLNEQQHAAQNDWAYSVDIVDELQKVKAADLILFYFPLWWNGEPAILKGWFDRVLTMGTAWDGEHIFSSGLYRGKKAGVVVTVGEPESYYRPDGVHKASVQQMLYPLLHGTLAFCGFNVLTPFVAHGITAANELNLEEQIRNHRTQLENLDTATYLYTF